MKEIFKKLPEYDIAYLGDNARAPYGDKSDETIYDYTREAVDFLFEAGAELIVLACHTASAKALRRIQQEHLPENHPGKRVLGVAVPLVEEAVKSEKNRRLGIIGTKATVESHLYRKEIGKLRQDLEVIEQACPLLVPLIEEGWAGRPETNKILKRYLSPLKNKKVDALILGCTHYPLLAKDLSRILGRRTAIINPATIVAEKLAGYLDRHPEIGQKISRRGARFYFTTDDEKKFRSLGEKFLKEKIKEVKKIRF